ncbi:serine/threonine-protein kinase [Nonomuraea glycinis]|uniref:serine/threonine-protein kinase n=1 Tax=Nonomuraea glycinis TaxID=2047744 RepID=UPI002E12CAB2|nr:protein kinase [Nonomuraea glycinis]
MEVPGYTEIRELGRGATGHVMLAVRDSDGASVAIKHLAARLREDGDFLERFRAEAAVIGEFDSPHTARLLDYVENPGDAAIVMELVDGIPLRRLLRQEGGTGPQAALSVLKGALLGLAEAHRRGIVHRDFKPENVIITEDGGSKLVDFGVAVHAGEQAPLIGTPSYMAPEQWDGAPAGPSADIYAAAVVFYECLTGRRPFAADDLAALAYRHRHAAPELGGIDEEVRGLVRQGLAKDPADRPESAEAFLAELEATATEEYGRRWDVRGRSRLAALTVPFLMTRPLAEPPPDVGTTLFQSAFAPATKIALTGGLVLATGVAVVSVFLVWNEGPRQDGGAFPPAALATSPPPTPAPTPPPTSPPPATSGTATPAVTGGSPSGGSPSGGDPEPAATARPTWAPDTGRTPAREPSRTPVRSDPPREPTSRPTTSGPTTSRPTTSRPTTSRPTRTAAEPTPDRSTRTPGAEPEPTGPPATSAPGPSTAPQTAGAREPLVSVSVKVSLDVPVLSGRGDGLLDADIGLGLGTGLLGLVAVPGSVLLGRRLVVRRTPRPRDVAPGARRPRDAEPGDG